MPLGSFIGSASLLLSNTNTKKSTKNNIKKEIDKPRVFSSETIKRLERGKAEDFNLSSKYIESFLNEISQDLTVKANRILVVKGNKVIAEKYNYPYVDNAWDCVFSATKTVTALALGCLFDEGKVDLDKPACEILGIQNKVGNLANKKITLRHLLTMSTGNTFNEMESAVSKKWIKGFYGSMNKFPIGKKFEYNSLNTYIIGACVEKLSGKSLADFVQEKIFDPLNINDTYFEVSPDGVAKSGWGLYILPEDMAKLGIMVRDYGVFDGKQIISKEWIEQMSTKEIASTKYGHRFDYGYQMWVKEDINFCCFNGMFNQDILIYRNTGFVIVLCSANNEAFHGSNEYNITEKYFAKDYVSESEYVTKPSSFEVDNQEKLMYYYDKIINKTYKPVDKDANSCGILPLILQNEMGTYSQGIKEMTFLKENDEYIFKVKEGETEYNIKFNFDKGIRQTLQFYGNMYDCVVDGRFIQNAMGEATFAIRVFFLEFAPSRFISIKFGKNMDELSVEFAEDPGLDFVRAVLASQDKTVQALLKGLKSIIDKDVFYIKTKKIFNPTFNIKHIEQE